MFIPKIIIVFITINKRKQKKKIIQIQINKLYINIYEINSSVKNKMDDTKSVFNKNKMEEI